jgi:hypothetical protein
VGSRDVVPQILSELAAPGRADAGLRRQVEYDVGLCGYAEARLGEIVFLEREPGVIAKRRQVPLL